MMQTRVLRDLSSSIAEGGEELGTEEVAAVAEVVVAKPAHDS